MPLGEAGASFAKSIENLGGDPENPFVIFDDVKAVYDKRKEELIKAAKAKKEAQANWEKENPELAKNGNNSFPANCPILIFQQWNKKPMCNPCCIGNSIGSHGRKSGKPDCSFSRPFQFR
jgi:transketolase